MPASRPDTLSPWRHEDETAQSFGSGSRGRAFPGRRARAAGQGIGQGSHGLDERKRNLRRLAGPEPFTPREERLFDAYAAQHYVREAVTNAWGESEDQWILDYKLPVTWVFIGWRTDGSAWA